MCGVTEGKISDVVMVFVCDGHDGGHDGGHDDDSGDDTDDTYDTVTVYFSVWRDSVV